MSFRLKKSDFEKGKSNSVNKIAMKDLVWNDKPTGIIAIYQNKAIAWSAFAPREHFMKLENVDGTFDPRRPGLLVYAKNPNSGKMRLVAVEYAVPNTEPIPEGFTGDNDVWVNNADFKLWLLHAWVWYHNPNGIFNPTNPRVNVEAGEITYP